MKKWQWKLCEWELPVASCADSPVSIRAAAVAEVRQTNESKWKWRRKEKWESEIDEADREVCVVVAWIDNERERKSKRETKERSEKQEDTTNKTRKKESAFEKKKKKVRCSGRRDGV